jgi:predicted RecA/RadA family phage recombinase
LGLKTIATFWFLVFVQQVISQKMLVGKVMVDGTSMSNVNINNITANKSTSTNSEGVFSIPISIDNILVFSAVNLETKRKQIGAKDMTDTIMIVRMNNSIIPLKEVKINDNSSITAENLGVIPQGQKKYSPAERRVHEATTGGGIVPLNPILNAMSGRTTMLKKEVVVEKKERLLSRLDGWFEERFYTDNLKLPQEYIKGFHYFLIEDDDFVRALKAKNKTLTKFLMNKLVIDYKETVALK